MPSGSLGESCSGSKRQGPATHVCTTAQRIPPMPRAFCCLAGRVLLCGGAANCGAGAQGCLHLSKVPAQAGGPEGQAPLLALGCCKIPRISVLRNLCSSLMEELWRTSY